MKVGSTFLWRNYPYPSDNRVKDRWFIYLGRYSEDPLAEPAYVSVIAPTVTSHVEYYAPGAYLSGTNFILIERDEENGFTKDSVLNLDYGVFTTKEDVFLDALETGRIVVKGRISDEVMIKILNAVYVSSLDMRVIEKIRDAIGELGIPNLPIKTLERRTRRHRK